MKKKLLATLSAVAFTTLSAFGASTDDQGNYNLKALSGVSQLLFPKLGTSVFPEFLESNYPSKDSEAAFSVLKEINVLKDWTLISKGYQFIDKNSEDMKSITLDNENDNLLITSFIYAPGLKVIVNAENLVLRGCIIADKVEFNIKGSMIIYVDSPTPPTAERFCELMKDGRQPSQSDVPSGTIYPMAIISAKNFMSFNGNLQYAGIVADEVNLDMGCIYTKSDYTV